MISDACPLVLGSASPRRRDILRDLGVPVRVRPAPVAEDQRPLEAPLDYVERIVADKLASAARQVGAEPFSALLVADTIVVLDGEVLGKPADTDEAERLLLRLAGRSHTVFTRYAVSRAGQANTAAAERTVATEVSLRSASDSEIRAYARTGEGLDKAGAYAAQGIGAFLIERIVGSFSNVVGLPACELILDLQRLGLLAEFPGQCRSP
jgi:septum formation protein